MAAMHICTYVYALSSIVFIIRQERLFLKSPAEEGTESWGGHSEKLKIFLLQKLNSYGEP